MRPAYSSAVAPTVVLGVCVLSLWAAVSCGTNSVRDPFASPPKDAGVDAGDAGPAEPGLIQDEDLGSMAPARDQTLGGPCLDDEQCDDGLACTRDYCDEERGRCRFMPDDAECQDQEFCNGAEVCQPGVGCRPGPPVSCDDKTPCTIDRCIESTDECEHSLRDADLDGDPDVHCVSGVGDCDDSNPAVSSLVVEICGNQIDDDCDQEVDERACELPQFDTCEQPLEILASGTHTLSTQAASANYASSCSEDAARDLVLEIVVQDELTDVELTVIGRGKLSLARNETCGDAATEVACEASHSYRDDARVSRLLLRELVDTRVPVVVFSDRTQELELQVNFSQASAAPTNETCGTAAPLIAGEHIAVDLRGAQRDRLSNCDQDSNEPTGSGDLFYSFVIDEPQDVRFFSASLDGYGQPLLSLQRASCAGPQTELACVDRDEAELFARALAPGEYFLGVSASAPTLLDLVMFMDAPSETPASENCEMPPVLEPGQGLDLNLGAYADDELSCLAGARDAAFSLELAEASDVLLVQRQPAGGSGAVALMAPACDEALACSSGPTGPLRSVKRALAAGSYRVLSESELGSQVQLTAFVRPTAPPTLVLDSDYCDVALQIPEQGGFFQGNTANLFADFTAGCDLGGIFGNGAADQILRFELSRRRRVVFEMAGSGYETLLDVRRGDECPGEEVPGACVVSPRLGRSYLDIVLEPGTYWVQIDGLGGAEGQWSLDVYTAEP